MSFFLVKALVGQDCTNFFEFENPVSSYNSNSFSAGTVIYEFGGAKLIKANDSISNPINPTVFDSVTTVSTPGRLYFRGKISVDLSGLSKECKKVHLLVWAERIYIDGFVYTLGTDGQPPIYIGDSAVILSNNGLDVVGKFSSLAFESDETTFSFFDGICIKECDGLENCKGGFDFDLNTGREVNFSNLSTISSSDSDVFSWDFGDGNTSMDDNPTNVYDNDGQYDVCLSIFRSECVLNKSIQICKTVNIASETEDKAQVKITPNGDGQDDFLFVEAGSKIFDRYGKLILNPNDNISWNGLDNNFNELPTGNYTVLKLNGEVFNVTIIR